MGGEAAVCSHDQQARILILGLRHGSVVEVDQIQAMALTTSISLLRNTHEHVVDP